MDEKVIITVKKCNDPFGVFKTYTISRPEMADIIIGMLEDNDDGNFEKRKKEWIEWQKNKVVKGDF